MTTNEILKAISISASVGAFLGGTSGILGAAYSGHSPTQVGSIVGSGSAVALSSLTLAMLPVENKLEFIVNLSTPVLIALLTASEILIPVAGGLIGQTLFGNSSMTLPQIVKDAAIGSLLSAFTMLATGIYADKKQSQNAPGWRSRTQSAPTNESDSTVQTQEEPIQVEPTYDFKPHTM